MKKFFAESALANLALIAFIFVYFVVERMFGAQGKYAFALVAIIGASAYAYKRWRDSKDTLQRSSTFDD